MADTPFDELLAWLDPDRDAAALKYETIRSGLIRIFIAKRFSNAEDLADEVIIRVTKRLPEIRDNYVGDPARYFYGVARHVIQEENRPKEIAMDMSLIAWIQNTDLSDLAECLRRCLQFLTPQKRELILDYYVYEGHDKVEEHKTMAQELGISKGALRLRAHHVRTKLEKCVEECLENL